jgi:DNA modification methylase
MPEAATDRPTDAYEHILMLTKSGSYYWDQNASMEPTNDLKRTRNPRNVWTFPTKAYKSPHCATFPEELPRRCILAASRPGDVILDPFGGAGTTAKVAVGLGRHAVSIDLTYHDIARERIAA